MRGTARPCRINRNAPAAQNEPPRAPAELSKRATEIFGTLVGRLESMRLASATDTELLALLAARLEEHELATENIRANGSTYAKIEIIEVPDPEHPGSTITRTQKMWKANPAVAQRSEAMRHCQSLLAEFGLSPASRARLAAPGHGKAADESNRWEALV
jgi:P27 family predicted phage terminase small subunit